MIDPAMFRIGRKRAAVALGVGRDHLAVVAAGDDALAVGRRRQDRAAMDGDAARLAVRLREHDRFLAEHEGRGAAEKMRGNDGAFGRDLVGAIDDGMGVVAAGVGHGQHSLQT